MRIIFAGTPRFAAQCLEELIQSGHDVIAVFTQPDKPAGRGQKLTPSLVKDLALAHQIPVYQPTSLRDPQQQLPVQQLRPDIMVVVAYGALLPAAVLAIPPLGCINVHPSLLPRWRGAAPIQRTILAGDTTTGVTIMQMDTGLDTGPMLKKAFCPVDTSDTSNTLDQKLAVLGGKTLVITLKELGQGKIHPEPQDPTQACYAKKIEKQEAQLHWQLSAAELDRAVRGFNPWPVAFTFLKDQMIRIWQTEVLSERYNLAPGTIAYSSKQGIDVATGDGSLRLLQIQLPGSRVLPIADILNAKAEWFAPGTQLGK